MVGKLDKFGVGAADIAELGSTELWEVRLSKRLVGFEAAVRRRQQHT